VGIFYFKLFVRIIRRISKVIVVLLLFYYHCLPGHSSVRTNFNMLRVVVTSCTQQRKIMSSMFRFSIGGHTTCTEIEL
jgi:hypothetical protein